MYAYKERLTFSTHLKGSLIKGLTDFLLGHNVRANQIFVSVSQSVGLYILRQVDWWIKHASCFPGTTNNFKFRLNWKNVKIGKRMKRTHNMNVPGALQDKDIGLGPLGISWHWSDRLLSAEPVSWTLVAWDRGFPVLVALPRRMPDPAQRQNKPKVT